MIVSPLISTFGDAKRSRCILTQTVAIILLSLRHYPWFGLQTTWLFIFEHATIVSLYPVFVPVFELLSKREMPQGQVVNCRLQKRTKVMLVTRNHFCPDRPT